MAKISSGISRQKRTFKNSKYTRGNITGNFEQT